MPIEDLSLDEIVQAVVLPASVDGLRPGLIADYLALVDWGGYASARPAVVALLGKLESWSTEFAEDVLTGDEYRARLRSCAVLSADNSRSR